MTQPSPKDEASLDWPIPARGARLLVPAPTIAAIRDHPLGAELYPTAIGHYPQGHGHNYRPHRRPSTTLFYCLGGSARLTVEGWQGEVTAGDLAIIPAGAHCAMTQHPDRPWAVRFITYKGVRDCEFTAALGPGPVARPGVQSAVIQSFETLLSFRSRMFDVQAFLHAASLTRALVLELACAISANRHARGDSRMATARQRMESELGQRLTLEELAEGAGLTKYHFCRRFGEETGYSPMRYLQQLRVRRACELLNGTDRPVQDIAMEVGFEDPGHFSRVFTTLIGRSPRSYRRIHMI